MTRISKIYFYVVAIGYAGWALYRIPKLPADEFRFAAVAASIFFFAYLLPPTIFGAKIETSGDGLHVEQYGRTTIPYSEVRRCYGFFFIPFQMVVVTTKRKFPLNILISGDSLSGRRRSLIQDGDLAARVKSRMSTLSHRHSPKDTGPESTGRPR